MIRINLLAGERKAKKKAVAFDTGTQITAAAACILLATLGVILWRVWAVHVAGVTMDTRSAEAQKETTRLHSIIVQVQQYEQHKAQLQQRVTLIEQLRREQIGPVHMLDQISLSLPSSLWLTEMKQTATPNEVLIDGRSLSITGVSDFVMNLEQSGYFQKSVEIVNSTTDTGGGPQGEVVKFQVKAVFKGPGYSSVVPAPAAKPGAPQLKPKG